MKYFNMELSINIFINLINEEKSSGCIKRWLIYVQSCSCIQKYLKKWIKNKQEVN